MKKSEEDSAGEPNERRTSTPSSSPTVRIFLKITYESSASFARDFQQSQQGKSATVFLENPLKVGYIVDAEVILSETGESIPLKVVISEEDGKTVRLSSDALSLRFKKSLIADTRKLDSVLSKHLQTPTPPRPVTNLAPFRVVLVEESPVVRSMLRFSLNNLIPLFAANGLAMDVHELYEAQDIVKSVQLHQCQLLIIDINSVKFDALDLIYKVRTDDRRMPIMALGNSVEGAHSKTLERGATCFIAKPIQLRMLTEIIEHLVAHGSLPAGGKG